ncbi:MAG: hypothetical protein OGMRLDGQ_001550 [Candidatus Fervidibacter sp.]|jgi:CRISPR-associated protein Csx14
MKKILLATLGESPAVVTEAIDRLKSDGVDIGAVTILTTKDIYAQEALNLLAQHIPDYYQGRVEFQGVAGTRLVDAFYDVDSDKAVTEFMQEACSVLRDYRRWAEVHVCIAGGRKAMSALLTLAVQFYGATSLFHIILQDPEIEEGGHITKLKNLPKEEQDRYLHPPIDQIKLVRLPFIGLFAMLGDILRGLRGEEVRGEVRELLEQNGLWQGGNITELGRMVLQVLENVETLPEPRDGECEIKLAEKEPKEVAETCKWADLFAHRFSFVKRIEDIGWREGQPKVKPEPPDKLVVFVPGRRVSGVGFRLTTTAQTEGQLQRAAQEVERLLNRELHRL